MRKQKTTSASTAASSQAPSTTGDLVLQCTDGSVTVSCALLEKATRNAAFTDILSLLRRDNPNASPEQPMTLSCKDDLRVVWERSWKIVEDPLAEHQLFWTELASVIELAHKYELTPVLQHCQNEIMSTTETAKPTQGAPWGSQRLRWGTNISGTWEVLRLSFLELLWRCELRRAYWHLLPKFALAAKNGASDTWVSQNRKEALQAYRGRSADPIAKEQVLADLLDALM